jgi:hypothetical protein
MSLKSIEMQIALPRTVEVGKIQENLQQRGQNMNDMASQRTNKEEEQKRTTVIKQEQKSNVSLSQEKKEQNRDSKKQQNKTGISEEVIEKKEFHPYKGNNIDYSG